MQLSARCIFDDVRWTVKCQLSEQVTSTNYISVPAVIVSLQQYHASCGKHGSTDTWNAGSNYFQSITSVWSVSG